VCIPPKAFSQRPDRTGQDERERMRATHLAAQPSCERQSTVLEQQRTPSPAMRCFLLLPVRVKVRDGDTTWEAEARSFLFFGGLFARVQPACLLWPADHLISGGLGDCGLVLADSRPSIAGLMLNEKGDADPLLRPSRNPQGTHRPTVVQRHAALHARILGTAVQPVCELGTPFSTYNM
jgi:hypothetical protein